MVVNSLRPNTGLETNYLSDLNNESSLNTLLQVDKVLESHIGA